MTSSSKYASAADKYLSPAAERSRGCVLDFLPAGQHAGPGDGSRASQRTVDPARPGHFAPEGPSRLWRQLEGDRRQLHVPAAPPGQRRAAGPDWMPRSRTAIRHSRISTATSGSTIICRGPITWTSPGTPRRSGSIAAASSALPSNVREFRMRRWCPMPAPIRRIPELLFNKAVTLSAMRRLMMQPMFVDIPGVDKPKRIPPVTARILLGGKVDGYAGFLPGIFEEALTTWQSKRPVYILGGFGGAAEVLADAMLARVRSSPRTHARLAQATEPGAGNAARRRPAVHGAVRSPRHREIIRSGVRIRHAGRAKISLTRS